VPSLRLLGMSRIHGQSEADLPLGLPHFMANQKRIACSA
jgi:hypothetical protein